MDIGSHLGLGGESMRTEQDLQVMTDIVARTAGDKHKYHVKLVSTQMTPYGHFATADTPSYFKTGRRVITFGQREAQGDIHSLLDTVEHEIAHFHEAQRYRHRPDAYWGHRHHTKPFRKALAKLQTRMKENVLTRLKCAFPAI